MDLRDIKEFFSDFLGYVVTLVVIILIFTFVVSFQPIAGNSMTPKLSEGNIVMVSKISYLFSNPKRNDIITFTSDNEKRFVKRIIGLPGEKIDYLNGVLYINDVGYIEKFILEDVQTSNFMFEDICSISECPSGVIPDDYYLVLGDYREDSQDSRDSKIGLINKKQIEGKVVFRIWPINKIGKI